MSIVAISLLHADIYTLAGVLDQPVSGANDKIPMIVYAMYQSGFAGVVTALSIGATAERGRIFPTILFIFCWLTIVYCPIARWVWHPSGWAFNLGYVPSARPRTRPNNPLNDAFIAALWTTLAEARLRSCLASPA